MINLFFFCHPFKKNAFWICIFFKMESMNLLSYTLWLALKVRLMIIKQGRRKLLENGRPIYIFASNSVNFWQIFKILFSTESWSQFQICQKKGAQLRTLRTKFCLPCKLYTLISTGQFTIMSKICRGMHALHLF